MTAWDAAARRMFILGVFNDLWNYLAGATPISTPTPAPSLTATPTPTSTPTATGTPTLTPSASPSPSPTASDTPTLTPSAMPTMTDTPTPTTTPTLTATPASTASDTPTPTASPTPTPATPLAEQTVTFDDLVNPNRVMNGQYPTGVIRWGTNRWFLSGPFGAFASNSIRFNRPASKSETISFLMPRRLVQLSAYNGSPEASKVVVSCAGQPLAQVVVAPKQQATLVTSWTAACSTVTFDSSNGRDTNFDDLVIDAGVASTGGGQRSPN